MFLCLFEFDLILNIYSLETSNVLLLDLNVMKTLPMGFDGIHQLSTGNENRFVKSVDLIL
jgi:hypothetical protein